MKISTKQALRAHYGLPSELVQRKCLPKLDAHCQALMAASPFMLLATHGVNGGSDVSPRGDKPGFVRILDDTHFAFPDWPGNKRLDSLENIIETGAVGLLFMIPGMQETLRINGKAEISLDPRMLALFKHQDKQPVSVIVVQVQEAYMHCAKALVRAKLWDPERFIDRRDFPSLGKIIADQIAGFEADQVDEIVKVSLEQHLY